MAKAKRSLELAQMPLAMCGTDSVSFQVFAGRWVDQEGRAGGECAVIVQERTKGPLGQTTVFKMAVDEIAVGTVCEGLEKWFRREGHSSQFFPEKPAKRK